MQVGHCCIRLASCGDFRKTLRDNELTRPQTIFQPVDCAWSSRFARERHSGAFSLVSFPGRRSSATSRRTLRPSFAAFARPFKRRAQGRPGAGRTHGPPANKKQAASPQDWPNNRPSLRDGLNGCSVLSQGTGLACPRHRDVADQDTSVGVSGPHVLTVRKGSFVRTRNAHCDPRRPPHPTLHGP